MLMTSALFWDITRRRVLETDAAKGKAAIAVCILVTPSSFTLFVSTPLSLLFYPVGCHHACRLLPCRTFQNLRYRLLAFFLSYSDSWPVKGPIRCPETPVNNYHTTPRNIPEERRSNYEYAHTHTHTHTHSCVLGYNELVTWPVSEFYILHYNFELILFGTRPIILTCVSFLWKRW
jgi:hypothetical protein